MPNTVLRFLTSGRNSRNGLAGYLMAFLKGFGTATVASGGTSIVVTDSTIAAGDIIIASPTTVGANNSVVVGTTISAGVSFTINVDTDPGAGGVVLGYVVFRAAV